MTRVLLLGAAGRMGCAVQSAAQAMPDITIVAGVDRAPLKGSALPVFHELSACGIPADVLVEFSSPQAVAAALPICTVRFPASGLHRGPLRPLPGSPVKTMACIRWRIC